MIPYDTAFFLSAEPKITAFMVAIIKAPPTMLPRVTGSKFPRKNDCQLTPAPSMIPKGIMNMFATECSNFMATKAEIGNQIAIILPPRSLAPDAM
mmetsp:Transcript_42509/g.165921  ORF Transcript_42509/g.165921 Transcript_42509/m.165921 type:complete len:95 (-) Transcript_42509:676-960(-)